MLATAPTSEDNGLDLDSLVEIAGGLALVADGWLGQNKSDATVRIGLRLLSVDRYDVWILRWPPGTAVNPHDHGGSSAAFAVAAGTLKEVRWCGGVRTERVLGSGESATIEAGVVHDVVALDEGALSVHVYSPPLSRMAYFDKLGQTVVFEEELDAGVADFVSRS